MSDIEYKGYIRYIAPNAAVKRHVRTSTSAARRPTSNSDSPPPSLPSTVITCLQYNAITDNNDSILVCSKCSYYLQDRLCKPKIFNLANNLPQKPVPFRLQCEWPLIQQPNQSVTPLSLRSPNIRRHTRFNDGGHEILSVAHLDSSPLRDSVNNNHSSPLDDNNNNSKKRKSAEDNSNNETTPSAKKTKRKRKNKNKEISSLASSSTKTTTTTLPILNVLETTEPVATTESVAPIYSPRSLALTTTTNDAITPSIPVGSKVRRHRLLSKITDLEKQIETVVQQNATNQLTISSRDNDISEYVRQINVLESSIRDNWSNSQKSESDLRYQLLVERKKSDSLEKENTSITKKQNDIRTSSIASKKVIDDYQSTITKLLQQLETMKREAYQEGVRHGIEHQEAITAQAVTTTNHQLTIPVPSSLDPKSLSLAIDSIFDVVQPTKRPKVRGNLLAQAVWHMYSGQCQLNFLEWTEEMLRRKNPYRQAEEIAKIMDLSSGQLNLSGYHALRQGMEKKNKNGKVPYGKGWLCSRFYVQQAQYAVERAAVIKMPYTTLPDVDGFVFDYEKSTEYINDEVLKLADVAKDPTQPAILIGCTLDGVRVSANVVLIIAGTKVLDPRAIDPRTEECVSLFQSPFLCFPMKIVVCPDSKSSYKEHFSDFFEFFNNIHERQIGDYPPGTFYSAWPQDGSSVWKATGRGGGCKSHIEFCSYCPCKSGDCASPIKIPCDDCKAAGEKECFHRRVGDAATMAKYQESLEKLNTKFPFITGNPSSRFKLLLRYEPDELLKDDTNIHFQPQNKKQRDKFHKKVNKDLLSLRYSCLGTIKERKKKLLKALKAIHRFEEATIGLEACSYKGALIQIKQAIPCILHLENRCGEKFIKMILKEVLQQQNKTPKQENEFIAQFEELVNNQILGQPDRPSNWKVPVSKKEKKFVVGDLTMPCPNVRKFLNKFDKITTLAFPDDPTRKAAWDSCIELWQVIIKQANKHEDFTNEDIDSFQKMCDEWGKLWLDLVPGNEGMTNYIHMVIAGHLKYYLEEWRNLYRFSQQGWEGLNSVIKSVMHNRSQGGGSAGRGKGQRKTSKVEAVVRWCLRRNFFLSGDYKLVEYLKQKFS